MYVASTLLLGLTLTFYGACKAMRRNYCRERELAGRPVEVRTTAGI